MAYSNTKKEKRLFFALPLPSTIDEYITDLSSSLKDPSLRIIPRVRRHITLLFLGNCSEEKYRRLLNMELVFKRYRMQLAGTEIFPSLRHPRALSIVVSLSPHMTTLRKDIQDDLNMPKDAPYISHITVAYLRRGKEYALPSFQQRNIEPLVAEESRIHLLESLLSAQNPHYHRCAAWDAVDKEKLGTIL